MSLSSTIRREASMFLPSCSFIAFRVAMRGFSTFSPVSLPRQANRHTAMLGSADLAHPSSVTVSGDAFFRGQLPGGLAPPPTASEYCRPSAVRRDRPLPSAMRAVRQATVRAPSFHFVGMYQSAAPLIQQPRRHVGVIVGRVPGIVVNTGEFRVTNVRTKRS
jgi:hypothetical protein